MAILEILDTEIEQECEHCGATHKVKNSDISVGIDLNGQIDTKIITLPACPKCGAREYLFRSAENELEHPSPGSFGHRHRLMVDVFHSKLVKEGRIIDSLDPVVAKGRDRDSEELERWFKGRMRIQRSKETDVRLSDGDSFIPWSET